MIIPEPRHILKIPSLKCHLDFVYYCTVIKVRLVPIGVYLILVLCSSAGGPSPNNIVLKSYDIKCVQRTVPWSFASSCICLLTVLMSFRRPEILLKLNAFSLLETQPI